MKKISILLPLFFLCFLATAQKKQNTYFLKNNGKEVELKDSADFIRIIQEPDSGEVNYKLFEFYKNDKKKKQGYVSSFKPRLVFEGNVVSFDRNGIKTNLLNYKNGKLIGMAYYFLSNGKLRKQVEFMPQAVEANQMRVNNAVIERIIYLQDTLGVVLIKDGNGHLKQTLGSKKTSEFFEEGDYKDGFKDGIWKGQYTTNTNWSFTEVYKDGKLISGESTYDGKVYNYTVSESVPSYEGGTKAWADFISRTTKYPKFAMDDKASGTVLTSFVIDKEGKVTDIKIVKSIHSALDSEAKRVLQQSARWTPGMQRGVPVKVTYNQAFTFRTN